MNCRTHCQPTLSFCAVSELEESSITLALYGLRGELRRLAARDVDRSMAVELRRLAGYKPGEIRDALGLTVKEYAGATARLREALRR